MTLGVQFTAMAMLKTGDFEKVLNGFKTNPRDEFEAKIRDMSDVTRDTLLRCCSIELERNDIDEARASAVNEMFTCISAISLEVNTVRDS